MWDYARQGIYVKVRMNRVVSFWPFVNMNYANGLPIEDFWWVSREEFPGGLGIATKNAGAGE